MDSHLLFYKNVPIEVLITKMATIHDSRYVIQLPDFGFVLQQTIDGEFRVQGAVPASLEKELQATIITLLKTTYSLKRPIDLSDFLITIEVNSVPVRLVVKQTKLSAIDRRYTVIAKNKTLILERKTSANGFSWNLINGSIQDASNLRLITDAIETAEQKVQQI